MANQLNNDTKDPANHTNGQCVPLRRMDADYKRAENLFRNNWKHHNKAKPYVHAVLKILSTKETLQPYLEYRAYIHNSLPPQSTYQKEPGNECLLFHGTNRACLLGENSSNVQPCFLPECSLCCIIRKSFDIEKCGSNHRFQRFGTGIYTTPVSSKADDYCRNLSEGANLRAVLLNYVVVGEPRKMKKNATDLIQPPAGFHSILGKPGQDLNYKENVVYRNDAIRPAFVLLYGDTSPKVDSKLLEIMLLLFRTPLAS